jgi:AcrR family transcriptional regulator
MATQPLSTRDRLVAAASTLFYAHGIRAIGVDAIAAKAGVTKRTLYYHFASKDELVAAYLAVRDTPNLAAAEKVRAVFKGIEEFATHPKWRGCGFLRTPAELADLPGHPAIKLASAHKKRVEAWFAEVLGQAGAANSAMLARQVMVLLDGALADMLVHRDRAYIQAAGQAASSLVAAALPVAQTA